MKVLVLSCNTGEGHNSAARAVREEFCRRGTPCDMVDALGIVGAPNSRAASAAYGSIITHTPRLFGAIYRAGELYNSTGINPRSTMPTLRMRRSSALSSKRAATRTSSPRTSSRWRQ